MPTLRRSSRVCVAASAALLLTRALGGQTAPPSSAAQAPVFRGGVMFVSVDVYPRQDGKVIEGLTAADFQVLEDGKPQTVETFELVKIEPNPADSDRRDPNSQADSERQARDPKNRVFVVYLDVAHTTIAGSHAAKQPVLDFLTRTIGRTDLFGVMTPDVPVGSLVFGRRTETLEAEMTKFWTWGEAERLSVVPRTPVERRLSECALVYEGRTGRPVEATIIQLHREEQLIASLENLADRLRDLKDERKSILFVSEGWVPRGPRDDLLNVSVSEGKVPPIGVGPGGRIGIGRSMQPFNTDTSWCDTQIRRLANIDFERRFRELLTRARNANVAFYPLDVAGLRVSAPLGGPRDTLLTLAENTDGIAIANTNDLQAGARRIADALSTFYLLGYYSTNPATDGRFRRIEVKVNRPRVDVAARRGYLAPTAALVASAAAGPTGPTPVDEALGRLAAIREEADLFVHGAPGDAAGTVTAELSAASASRDQWRPGGAVEFTATGPDGAKLSARGVLAAGERSVRVDLPGLVGVSGPWQVSARLTAGAEVAEARTTVSAAPTRLVGEPSAWRGAASPRVPFRPLADLRLTRLERLRVQWPILRAEANRTARLLDRKGQPLGGALPFTNLPTDSAAATVDLPLTALSEGDFVLELVATLGEVVERRLLAFRVVR